MRLPAPAAVDLPASVRLPYYRDAAELPGPLPTQAEIHDAASELDSADGYCKESDGGMGVIRGTYFAKFGPHVTENEGNALLFIEKHLDIPAPRLYAMYRDYSSGYLYMITEYARGVGLDMVWGILSTGAKSSISMQLKHIFWRMRSLSPPPAFIGGVAGGGLPDPFFHTENPDPSINGPFRTAEEVGSAIALRSRRVSEENGKREWQSGFLSRNLAAALKDHEVVFTHGDLTMRNIVVEKVPAGEPDVKWNYRVKCIVGWDSAGWYPAYWEYASAILNNDINMPKDDMPEGDMPESDWPEVVDTIFTPHPLELSMIALVLEGLRIDESTDSSDSPKEYYDRRVRYWG
ncbi:hypothetical protein ACRE_037740 [Hapsidospora chrysogenum ATCC 11550]|uniref:Aminoglycoside phosphotransferase domain-containing protein n=1 Tax=Hapsidospora chrysogenum (strain ATCC 11550 / CBS 779.69 / DSM 880 / IAM 14645 / JCM 23072 / IMI 49137) TaxID=857340 RepID=A0A086T7T1_HAPC1|nr:hypothetical protein ACRE_037740 [Hapsidospora chrysogenum ATCC 11550]